MKKVELLAPAGSMESLYAAVQNGADAVYLGGAKFSARAYASNFDEENMIKAVEYCHLYNVKVYITVNTLIKEEEIKEAIEYIKLLYEIGVDALIIQDTGVAELVRRNFPDFEIHASTQMTVHNGEGALLLKKLGFSRIVLSRELSLEEIEYISKDLDVETEIFIHGALCISYSGQCLMSSLIGGRSGNRGRCAQPCRLPYEIINKTTGKVNKAYILSPKDICTIENVPQLIESGTSSLKIEGRMKRPEYVAGVVAAYRKAIDEAYNSVQLKIDKGQLKDTLRSESGRVKVSEKVNIGEEKRKLLKLFNREGFSKAYLFGNIGRDMMSYKFPKNTGVPIGKVNRDFTIELKEDISLQDGIRFGDEGFTIFKIVKGSENVEEAFVGDRVKLKPTKYKPGDILYKTSDVKLLESLAQSYKDIHGTKKDLSLKVNFMVGYPMALQVIYGDKAFSVEGEVVQKALKKPMEKEQVIEKLKKTRDTPFNFKEIEFENFEEGFISVSSINALRRELIESISEYIKKADKRSHNKGLDFNIRIKKELRDGINSPLVIVTTNNQLKAAQECDIENMGVEIFMRDCNIDIKKVDCKNLFIKTPSIIKEEFHKVCEEIEELLPHVKGIITSNLGIINKFKGKTLIIGDYKLNNFNSYSLEFYKESLDIATISLELNKKEIINLLKKASLPSSLIVYGKTELMVSEYCPIGSVFGGKNCEYSCGGECQKGDFLLKDRMGAEFPITTDKQCKSHIYNSSALNLIPNLDEIAVLKVDLLRIDFVNETYEEALDILEGYESRALKGEFKGFTRGHFKRGVE